jgi:hypothetical protein
MSIRACSGIEKKSRSSVWVPPHYRGSYGGGRPIDKIRPEAAPAASILFHSNSIVAGGLLVMS